MSRASSQYSPTPLVNELSHSLKFICGARLLGIVKGTKLVPTPLAHSISHIP